MSRVGWLCGWNSASKFQKEDSTKRLVGISPNLQCATSKRASQQHAREERQKGSRRRQCPPRGRVTTPTHPISSRICRNSPRTFIKACSCPPPTSDPALSPQLYSLKVAVAHSPLQTSMRAEEEAGR